MPPTLCHFQFQFHKGTIKTDDTAAGAREQHQFQFHKGTIKTHHNTD